MFAQFIQTWLTGYYRPSLMIERLKDKPAPQWGFYGAAGRALLDSIFLYVPLSLLGRVPSTPSWLTFIPTSLYYRAEIIMAPIILLVQWLFLCSVMHLILSFSGRKSDINQIMNITGMVALVVGTILLIWDWIYIVVGLKSANLLGISHLIIDIWVIVISVKGFKKILDVPVWLGILLMLLWILLGMPFAVFIRGPV